MYSPKLHGFLASLIILTTSDQIGNGFGTLRIQPFKKIILTIDAECSAVMESAITSKSEKVGTTPHLATFPFSFTRFPANCLQIPRIFLKFVMKLRISKTMAFVLFLHY